MWVLEPTQAAAIRRATFLGRVERSLGVLFAIDALPGALIATIDRLAVRAAAHGFVFERDVFRFASAAWVLGESFDERVPPLTAMLARVDLAPTAKAVRLERAVTATISALGGELAAPARSGAADTWGDIFRRLFERASAADRERARAALLDAVHGRTTESADTVTPGGAQANTYSTYSATVRFDQADLSAS